MYQRRFSTLKLLHILFLLLSLNSTGQVVINEVMVNPGPDTVAQADQSLAVCTQPIFGREWVELYNPSKCDTVDLSCYILASRTSADNGGGYSFPAGAKLAPLEHILVGGGSVSNADFIIPNACNSSSICLDTEWNLPNDFGWIAIYTNTGDVADAVFWTAQAGQVNALINNAAYSADPCTPSSCSFVGNLKNASSMPPGQEIFYAGSVPSLGLTIARIVDGTGSWQTNATPTPDNCNGPCAIPSDLTLQLDSLQNEGCFKSNGAAFVSATGGIGFYEFIWSNGFEGDSIVNVTNGTYTATVFDSLSCTFSLTISIQNFGDSFNLQIIPGDVSIIEGTSTELNVISDSPINFFRWTPQAGLSCLNCEQLLAGPFETTQYSLQATDENGCISEATTLVRVVAEENSLFVPNIFTPNNDGQHDLLFVRSPKLMEVDFRIYDRWGNEVFRTSDSSVGWDGNDTSGNPLNPGVYVYYVEAVFSNEITRLIQGNVTLLR